MYVNKAICESFAAINEQMVERITKLSPPHTAGMWAYQLLSADFSLFRDINFKNKIRL